MDMKSKYLPAIIILFCASILSGCNKPDNIGQPEHIDVTSLSISPAEVAIAVGETIALDLNIIPENACGFTICWTSSDNAISTVDEKGLVSGIGEGVAVISAEIDTMKASCEVIVNSADSPDEKVFAIFLNFAKYLMKTGETIQLEATLVPSDAECDIIWSTSDATVATVDRTGLVTGISDGTASVYAKAGTKTAKCEITVQSPDLSPKSGYFYYTDGTWSKDLDYNRKVLGIVFYTGDPTLDDPILKRDHPECTHGLAISAYANVTDGSMWQPEFITFGKPVSDWVLENLPGYQPTESNYGQDNIRNSMIGYNCTDAIRKFNKANPEYAVLPVEKLESFSMTHPAPSNSSGWYLPSIKELFILINGIPDNPEILSATKTTENIKLIDNALYQIYGSNPIVNQQWAYNLWSSMEFGAYVYTIETFSGTIEGSVKDNFRNFLIRYILAF